MMKVALLAVFAQIIVAIYADCSAENIEKLQSCYRDYVPNSPPAPGLIPDKVCTQVDLMEITPDSCQAFAKLQACLNSDIVDTCINPATFTRANGFDYNPATENLKEGAQWTAHFKILSQICAIDEKTHMEVAKCEAQVEHQLFTCKFNTCDDLSSAMTCAKGIFDSACPSTSEEAMREMNILLCAVFDDCSYCKQN